MLLTDKKGQTWTASALATRTVCASAVLFPQRWLAFCLLGLLLSSSPVAVGCCEMGSSVEALQADAPAIVLGAVMDPTDAVVVGNTVLLRSYPDRTVAARAQVNHRGEYRCAVPAGAYTIELEDTRSTLPYERAPFRVRAGKEHVVNVYPVFRSGIALTIKGDEQLRDPSVETAEIRAGGGEREWGCQVRYTQRAHRNGRVEFGGTYLMLTCDLLTIRASDIAYHRKSSIITVEGRIKVSIGGDRFMPEKAEVDLGKRTLRMYSGASVAELVF
jgi:hypothetical protein